MNKIDFIACKHISLILDDCDCISRQEIWNNLYQCHFDSLCSRSDHQLFKSDGYIKAVRPVWLHDCRVPFEDPFLQQQLLGLCKELNLHCECTWRDKCQLCSHLIGMQKDSFQSMLYLGPKEKWDMKIIKQLLPFMSFAVSA